MSHVPSVKHLFDNRSHILKWVTSQQWSIYSTIEVTYWNESCPSSEEFIRQQKSLKWVMSQQWSIYSTIEVTYWNESCPSSEAFIRQQKSLKWVMSQQWSIYSTTEVTYWNESCPSSEAFIRQQKSHTEMSHVPAVKHLFDNRSHILKLVISQRWSILYTLWHLSVETMCQRLKLSGICMYGRNKFPVNWNQSFPSIRTYQILLSFCVANSSHSSASPVLFYVIKALDVLRTPEYRIAKCNLILRLSKERVISAENFILLGISSEFWTLIQSRAFRIGMKRLHAYRNAMGNIKFCQTNKLEQ
jgi:hypothetical protein